MSIIESISDWVQVGLNAGALVVGGVVWKMYFENLKTTIGTKDAQVNLANKQVEYWREKATELEKRSPEAMERVLAERIAIRENEIERLATDREHNSQELEQARRELGLSQQILEQTRGFREVLAMEQPKPGDPDYEDFVKFSQDPDEQPSDIEVVYIGAVGVDSGQLLITDPSYIDSQWSDEPFEQLDRTYTDKTTGDVFRWGQDFTDFSAPLPGFAQSVNELIESGRLEKIPSLPWAGDFRYSYNGSCQATLSSDGFGELAYERGHAGAGVAFRSGWGDGFYPVYGEKHDGRIMRVYINLGAVSPLSGVADGAQMEPGP